MNCCTMNFCPRTARARRFDCVRPQGALFAAFLGIASLLAWSAPAAAQPLQLFEEVEQSNSGSGRRSGSAGSVVATLSTEPEFVLKGTSRIGERRQVLLQHRDGQVIEVPLQAAGPNPIPGHGQYRVVAEQGRRVGVSYPANGVCVSSAQLGVGCDDVAKVMWLSLRTGPVTERFVVDLDTGEADATDEANETDEAAKVAIQARRAAEDLARDPENPFVRLRAEALGQEVPTAPRFTPRRIDPADVPPGMRVVSTPFGDRLVELD